MQLNGNIDLYPDSLRRDSGVRLSPWSSRGGITARESRAQVPTCTPGHLHQDLTPAPNYTNALSTGAWGVMAHGAIIACYVGSLKWVPIEYLAGCCLENKLVGLGWGMG